MKSSPARIAALGKCYRASHGASIAKARDGHANPQVHPDALPLVRSEDRILMPQQWWTFDRVKVRRVIDGDTIDVTIDLGFTVFSEIRLRLFGINAPESKGATKAAGLAAANQLRQLIPVGSDVRIETLKCTEKYGRWLAKVYVGEQCVNERMIADGYAVVAEY